MSDREHGAIVEWHLIKGTSGTLICKFTDKQIADDWLSKQIAFNPSPNNYFYENKVRIERFPLITAGQMDMFELLDFGI